MRAQWLVGAALILFPWASPQRCVAIDADTVGRTLYLQYCGVCHGHDGTGSGMVGELMDPKPSDLTRLTNRSGGRFPFQRMIRVIDGRETFRAHGDPDMPVWGDLFQGSGEPDEGPTDYIAGRGKVLLIVEHLRAIQRY